MTRMLAFLIDCLLSIDVLASLLTRSATVRVNGRDAGGVATVLSRDPTPVWPGQVSRAQVEKTDDGVRVSWYRWRRRTPSWRDYTRQVDRELHLLFPGTTVTVGKGRFPAAMANERYRP